MQVTPARKPICELISMFEQGGRESSKPGKVPGKPAARTERGGMDPEVIQTALQTLQTFGRRLQCATTHPARHKMCGLLFRCAAAVRPAPPPTFGAPDLLYPQCHLLGTAKPGSLASHKKGVEEESETERAERQLCGTDNFRGLSPPPKKNFRFTVVIKNTEISPEREAGNGGCEESGRS